MKKLGIWIFLSVVAICSTIIMVTGNVEMLSAFNGEMGLGLGVIFIWILILTD